MAEPCPPETSSAGGPLLDLTAVPGWFWPAVCLGVVVGAVVFGRMLWYVTK